MRSVWLVVAIAGCDASAAPAKQVDAWQAFAVGPFKTMKSGHVRAFWAADVAEPAWIKDTFAGLEIASYDGTMLAGIVDLWAGAGLDPMKCVPEVLWDSRGKHGMRVDHPPQLARGANGGWHAIWRFEGATAKQPQVITATAFVFCPIDDAHVRPPEGATFTSLDVVAAGPKARETYCARKPNATRDAMKVGSLAGKKTMDVAFACGVLVRERGRELVDDCNGDVLLSLDALGGRTTTSVDATGTPPTDEELGHLLAGSDECRRLTLSGFDARSQRAWDTALARLGRRVTYVGSRDGMIQP